MNLPEIRLSARPKGLRFDMPAVLDPRFEVTAAADGAATITIFDVIGLDVTDNRIAAALRSIGGRPVTVQINSPGGDYYQGIAIYNLLRGHGHPVTVQVLGIAASAASIIAMAGASIEIARNAEIMIHQAQTIAIGDAGVMADAAAFLRDTDEALAETYALRTDMPVERVKALMAAETFMLSAQALALGFADKLLDRDAEPKPRISNRDGAPRSKIEAEQDLRRLGLTKAAASRGAAALMAAITPVEFEVDPVLEAVKAHALEIQKIRNPNRYW